MTELYRTGNVSGMSLQSYLDEKSISDEQFGASIGVSATSVYRYRTGRRKPEDEIMTRIFKVTHGVVDANSFYKFKTKTNGKHIHSLVTGNL